MACTDELNPFANLFADWVRLRPVKLDCNLLQPSIVDVIEATWSMLWDEQQLRHKSRRDRCPWVLCAVTSVSAFPW